MSAYLPHQVEKSDEVVAAMLSHHLVCLWGEPRSGKTRTIIRACEKLPIEGVLVLTKKNAIDG